MIHTITTASGRKIHVAPDNEPVFNHSEITQMVGMDPDAAELIALVKEVFPGAKVETVKHYIPEKETEQMVFLGFNAAEQQEEMRDGFEVIPAGEYKAAITDSDMLENSAKTGHYLKLEITIVEGPYNGRKIFTNLNLDNPNQTAVDIARAELKSICSAIGKPNAIINDSNELHDQPMTIKVKVEKRKDNGEDSNRIKGYAPLNGAGSSSTAPKQSGGAKTGAKPPWVK